MSDFPMMKCGCAGQALISINGGPDKRGCGLHTCTEVAEPAPDLTGRIATCSYGNHRPVASSPHLAFFRCHPDKEHDEYYCGCYGWD